MSDKNNSSSDEMLRNLKQNLRADVLEDVMSMGLRNSIIEQYKELTGAASELIGLLAQTHYAESLDAEGKRCYDQLMARLSVCGIRCQILVEESFSVDDQAFLAVAPAPTAALN